MPQVLRLQLAGKKAMSVTDFMNGFVKGRKIRSATAEDHAKVEPLAAGKQGAPQTAQDNTVRTQQLEQTRAGAA